MALNGFDLHQLNCQFSKERRKDFFPKVLRTNPPVSLRARTHSLCCSSGPSTERFKIQHYFSHLKAVVLSSVLLISLWFCKYEIKNIPGCLPKGSQPSQQEGWWLQWEGLLHREGEDEEKGGWDLRRMDRDGRDHPGDKENMGWGESWGSFWACTVANCQILTI